MRIGGVLAYDLKAGSTHSKQEVLNASYGFLLKYFHIVNVVIEINLYY